MRSGATEYDSLRNQSELALKHAEYRINTHTNEFDQIDAILALKRAMQSRLDHLDRIYHIKQYPQYKQIGWLGILESWGVIRQRMLRRMRQLRNSVEHDGAEPPSLDDCQDYCEVLWWFLRGTAPLLFPLRDMAVFFNEGELSLSFEYNPIKITGTGTLDPEMLSDSALPGWAKIKTRPGASDSITPQPGKIEGTLYVAFTATDPEWVSPLLRMGFEELLEVL